MGLTELFVLSFCFVHCLGQRWGFNTLVLVDNLNVRETHSIFFKSLADRGHSLTFKNADDSSLQLTQFGDFLYDNLIIFSPTVEEFGGFISTESIVEFIDAGGNLLVAGSRHTGDVLRELAAECGLEMDEENAAVIDHLSYHANDEGWVNIPKTTSNFVSQHTLIEVSSDNLIKAPIIHGEEKLPPFLYQGTGILSNPDNELLLSVLHANSSSYSYNPEQAITQYPHAVGKNLLLIAALQARNNARVVFSGSLDFFSNDFFTMPLHRMEKGHQPGNQKLAEEISEWVFQEKGVLRVGNITHHKLGELTPPADYTVMDDMVYVIELEQRHKGKWLPFNATDVQLEFVRIDPFIRTSLKQRKDLRYEAQFKVPDVYGIYQLKVNYNRVGFTRIHTTTLVVVRPLKHTEYQRFIFSAYPYYISVFSMMIGVLMLSCVHLHYKDPKDKQE